MPDIVKKFIDEVAYLFIISAAVTLAGVLVIDIWRKSPATPAAGLILGIVFGYGASVAGDAGGAWIVFWTIVGTIAGPNVIVWLQGEGVAAQLGQLLLDKFSHSRSFNEQKKSERAADKRDSGGSKGD